TAGAALHLRPGSTMAASPPRSRVAFRATRWSEHEWPSSVARSELDPAAAGQVVSGRNVSRCKDAKGSLMDTVLVTGGCGFIGGNFIRHLLAHEAGLRVINLDCLSYAGNLASLADVADDPRYHFVRGDISDAAAVRELPRGGV